MKNSLVILILVLLLGVEYSMAQECKMCNYWLSKVDPKLACSDKDLAEEKLSDQKVLEIMKCLLKNKGNKNKANTLTASRSSKNSQTFDSPTIEVASLFYISSLFYENEDFAMAIALENENDERLNSRKSIQIAYMAYRKWFEKVKTIGLEEARRQKLDPLDGSGVSWY